MVKIIQNYTLHEQIGEGQYGKVFRGIDSRTKKEVAVKVINVKKFKQYPKLQECTLNQIEVLSNITSPYVVKFIEILKTANNFYFFYEFCNQGTLEERIKSKGTLQQKQALQYLSQILEAFQILSSKHIMHRDLKPSNILLSDGIIKLADFGFCKSLESHRDLAQTMLGSPIYMAPEVLKGQIYTIKADIWSLGVVIYQMLFGFCPFQERSIARLINLLDTQQVSFNSQINQVSPDLQKLVRRMLVKDHFKRISWDEIFAYKINGNLLVKSNDAKNKSKQNNFSQKYNNTNTRKDQLYNVPFLKTVSTEPQQKNQSKIGYQPLKIQQKNCNQLKQLRNFNNLPQKNISANPYISKSKQNSDYKMDYYDNKNYGHPSVPSMFKKKSSNQTNISQNTGKPQNDNALSNRILHYAKTINNIVKWNICPQITSHLCLRICTILQKEHNKLQQNVWGSNIRNQRQILKDTIQVFKQQSKKIELCVSGPLLNYYVKILQGAAKINNQVPQKQVLIHCLHLLDLNEFSVRTKINDYNLYPKERILTQIHQKVIRNVI